MVNKPHLQMQEGKQQGVQNCQKGGPRTRNLAATTHTSKVRSPVHTKKGLDKAQRGGFCRDRGGQMWLVNECGEY